MQTYKESRMNFDRAEIMLRYTFSDHAIDICMTYDKIKKITIEERMIRTFLFFKKPAQVIEISCRQYDDPIIYSSLSDPAFFEEYKTNIIAYAKKYRISLFNTLPAAAPAAEAPAAEAPAETPAAE